MISSKGKLGREGVIWFRELCSMATNTPQMVTEWEQQFLDSTAGRVEYYDIDTYLSEKQVTILTNIAEKLGLV